jgi:hypothetical protein
VKTPILGVVFPKMLSPAGSVTIFIDGSHRAAGSPAGGGEAPFHTMRFPAAVSVRIENTTAQPFIDPEVL